MTAVQRYDHRPARAPRAGVGAVGPQIVGSPCGNEPPGLADNPDSCRRFREYPLGFAQDAVPAGTEATINVQPQIPYKGDRLMIPSTIGDSFDVLDIKVGKSSQLPATQHPIPGEAFSEVAQGACVDMDTAQANATISLVVRNKSAVPVDFRAAMFGTAID